MKRMISLILAIVLSLVLCGCGNSDEEYLIKMYEDRIIELEEMLAQRDEEIVRLMEEINVLLAEAENRVTEAVESEPEYSEPEYETVEITLENWKEYFELRVFRIVQLNGFGEFDRMVTRYFIASKDGIIPDCHNSDVTMVYVCSFEVKPYVVDIENMTFTYGEVTDSYTSKGKVQTLWDVDVYVPTGNILDSEPGQTTFIYESGLGGDVEMYGDRIWEDSSAKTEDTAHVIVDVDLSRVVGTLRFRRQS